MKTVGIIGGIDPESTIEYHRPDHCPVSGVTTLSPDTILATNEIEVEAAGAELLSQADSDLPPPKGEVTCEIVDSLTRSENNIGHL